MTIYNVEDIFQEDPLNPDNVIMTIPQELCDELHWQPGDTLTITVQDDKLILNKK
jgi:AbrB family looped-hinge helix DNA binding protein